MANKMLGCVRVLFRFAADEGLILANPAAGMQAPHKQEDRDHVVSPGELKKIWAAGVDTGYPYGDLVRLLIVTLQRRGEVSGMRWTELDRDSGVWAIPPERSKTKRPIMCPFLLSLGTLLTA